MHFLLSSMCVVYVLTTCIPEDGKGATMDQLRTRAKWDNDDYVCRGLILNGMSNPLFDIYQNVETSKELYDSLEVKYMAEDASSNHLHIKESLRVQDNDKSKGNNVAGPSVVNMVEHMNSSRYNNNKGKCKHHDTKADLNKKSKMTC
nr:zinc finger, CCHC-type [Tanacetum cinerariifolium]